MTPFRRLAAVAAAASALLLLSGCITWFLPPRPSATSTPTGEQVPPGLERYYGQVLRWSGCGNGMQCATARAPIDWSDPAAGELELALVRQPARGERLGSVLVNPGGPGASGVDFILDSIDYATTERLQSRYDIVGFDPRGVGRSTPITCYPDPRDLDEFNFGILPGEPGSDEWFDAGDAAFREFGAACLEHTGLLLGFVDTVSVARDLDMLRAVLGDAKLNYLGYSYGSYIGATYAELFPERTGRMVLDGAVDPSTSEFEVTLAQATGFEGAYRAYLADCLSRPAACPFEGTVDDAVARTAALLQELQASPIRHHDGRMLGQDTMFYAIIWPLYSEEAWPYLDRLFAEVFEGETGLAFAIADAYHDRNPDGSYATNSQEAFIAVWCLDSSEVISRDEARRQAAILAEAAPVFGPPMAYGTGCEGWPFQGTRERMPILAPGSGDILVLGTTNDPATPYDWAVALAGQLERGHLVTLRGEGHTAYNKGSACLDDAVDDYFIDGALPPDGFVC